MSRLLNLWSGSAVIAAFAGCCTLGIAQGTAPAKPPGKPPVKAPAAPQPAKPAGAASSVLDQARSAWAAWLEVERAGKPATEQLAALQALTAWCAVNLPPSDVKTWPEVVASWRLTHLTSTIKGDERRRTADALGKLPTPVRIELGLLIGKDDKITAAATLAASLCAQEKSTSTTDRPMAWAGVIAAMAVVHDEPYVMPVNDLRARSAGAERLLTYYRTNQRRLSTDLAEMPPRLAIMVVDAPASVTELEWALNRYAGQANIKPRYNEVPYDNEALRTGKPVKAAQGWSLQSCLKGGVCAHQAYFASTVGKALGVPAVYVVADGKDMGHAWLGYCKVGPQGAWDFDTGRYDDYENARGEIRDPQTGATISDGRVAMSAGLMQIHPDARRVADALALAALVPTSATSGIIEGLTPPADAKPRPTGLPGALALLDEALRLSPKSTLAWDTMATASRGFSPQQRIEWSTRLMQATDACPDYALDVLGVMVDGVPDADQKIDLWDRVARSLASSRKDLAAEARLRQARAMDAANRPDAAWSVYQQVITQNVNDGPAVIDALIQCERMLKARQKSEHAVDLYAGAYAKARRPSGNAAAEFSMGSNWARIATRYHRLLIEAGRTRDAENVWSAIESVGIRRR